MKILITGGCGFVGSNIAIFLKRKIKNVKIVTIDNLSRKGSYVNKQRLKKVNIRNHKINIEQFTKIKTLPRFDVIIDCCAEPAIEISKKEPDRVFNTNLVGTYNVLKKCVKDKSNIIFLSSSRVYSIKKLRNLVKNLNLKKSLKLKHKINEEFDTSEVSSLYGFTKLASEKLIKELFFGLKQKYLINRFGVIAGPWQFGKQDQGFVPLWVARHLLRKKISYIGFGGLGNQVRDVIHIDDVCEIIYLQLKKFNQIYNNTFNIGGGLTNAISLNKLTIKCQGITKRKTIINSVKKTSNYDIPYFITDNKKLKKFYNWLPKKNIDKIIGDIFIWLNQNKILLKYFK
tara:strand:- start:4845 stop:5873 length:1029 start_codon:yes stop_codon:yes gene_type:complete